VWSTCATPASTCTPAADTTATPYAARRYVVGHADTGRLLQLTETATEVVETDPATFTFELATAYRQASVPRSPKTPTSVAPSSSQAGRASGVDGRLSTHTTSILREHIPAAVIRGNDRESQIVTPDRGTTAQQEYTHYSNGGARGELTGRW